MNKLVVLEVTVQLMLIAAGAVFAGFWFPFAG